MCKVCNPSSVQLFCLSSTGYCSMLAMLPRVTPSKKRRAVFLRTVHQLFTSVSSFSGDIGSDVNAHEEPHARTKSSCSESVERSGWFDKGNRVWARSSHWEN